LLFNKLRSKVNTWRPRHGAHRHTWPLRRRQVFQFVC